MSQPPEAHAQDLETLLGALWKRNYPTLLERLEALRAAQSRLAAGCLDEQTRKDAESAAHKLAGVLGTFGLPKGSELALKIETALARKGPVDEEELGKWVDQLEAVIASKS
jgi:HPt (histidine-containing phosphotransfer) domain-containing protein